MNYYIAPRFLDKISLHLTKNYLNLPGVKVPLILGIHGRKGEGKTFQCELAFQRMGAEIVHMSAGELEGPDAGDPARLIRLRYREAAELSKVRGRMAALMINDIDAGMGRVDQRTQYTVNTQLVAGTLMNITDNPTNVQLPGSYDPEPIQRIPIIVTGNDFATLYAPLVRDGRMEKFYWEPDRDDRIGIVNGIFAQDGMGRTEVEQLVDAFPQQSIDFFSALHSRLYDDQVRQLIQSVGIEQIARRVVNSAKALPEFHSPDFRLSHLMEVGRQMVREQQRIQELRLAREYTSDLTNQPRESFSPSHPVDRPSPQSPPANYSQPDRSVSAPDRSHNGHSGNGQARQSLDSEAIQVVQSISQQGERIAIEHVDQRRFRTNSWQSYAVAESESDAIEQLNRCLSEYPKDYVRLVGISRRNRRRMQETIVQRP